MEEADSELLLDVVSRPKIGTTFCLTEISVGGHIRTKGGALLGNCLHKDQFVKAEVFWYIGKMMYQNMCSLWTEAPPMPTNGDDYRELAEKIRGVAGRTRLPVARGELLRLASNYEQRADHLDRRAYLSTDDSRDQRVAGSPVIRR
jgi:hypothetical protein